MNKDLPEEEEVLVAVMRNGKIRRCFECPRCWVLLIEKNSKHNCCDNEEDDTIDIHQLNFIRNLKNVYTLADA